MATADTHDKARMSWRNCISDKAFWCVQNFAESKSVQGVVIHFEVVNDKITCHGDGWAKHYHRPRGHHSTLSWHLCFRLGGMSDQFFRTETSPISVVFDRPPPPPPSLSLSLTSISLFFSLLSLPFSLFLYSLFHARIIPSIVLKKLSKSKLTIENGAQTGWHLILFSLAVLISELASENLQHQLSLFGCHTKKQVTSRMRNDVAATWSQKYLSNSSAMRRMPKLCMDWSSYECVSPPVSTRSLRSW